MNLKKYIPFWKYVLLLAALFLTGWLFIISMNDIRIRLFGDKVTAQVTEADTSQSSRSSTVYITYRYKNKLYKNRPLYIDDQWSQKYEYTIVVDKKHPEKFTLPETSAFDVVFVMLLAFPVLLVIMLIISQIRSTAMLLDILKNGKRTEYKVTATIRRSPLSQKCRLKCQHSDGKQLVVIYSEPFSSKYDAPRNAVVDVYSKDDNFLQLYVDYRSVFFE